MLNEPSTTHSGQRRDRGASLPAIPVHIDAHSGNPYFIDVFDMSEET
jgi:hypothetical protein